MQAMAATSSWPSLTVEGGKITKAEVLEHSETAGVSDPALEQIPAAIVEKQGIEGIEAVAGCTRSSEGILAAAEAALVLAKGGEVAKVPTATMTEPDVIVVGGGMAGMTSAITAAENGAKVLLLEKTGTLGGTMGGGTLSGTGTKMQIESASPMILPKSSLMTLYASTLVIRSGKAFLQTATTGTRAWASTTPSTRASV